MSNYSEKGLLIGEPGTALWILREIESDGDIFWGLRHAFLGLGALKEYSDIYGLDDDLTKEQQALEVILATYPEEKVGDQYGFYTTARGYFETGKSNVRSRHESI